MITWVLALFCRKNCIENLMDEDEKDRAKR
jgi:hypothetical protein